MRFPIANLPPVIPVGVQTESGVNDIGIDVASWLGKWPDMTFSVWLTRPGETTSYPAGNVRMDGTVLIWTPDGYDTEHPGQGKLEILGLTTGGERRKLTGDGVCTMISGTTLASTSQPGAAEIPWVQKVLEAAKELKEMLAFAPEDAGKLVYIGADGKLMPLALGDSLAIVDGVLHVTYSPPNEPEEPDEPVEVVAFVEQADGSILMQGVTFVEQEDGSIMWDGATFTEQADGSYLVS